MFPLILSILVEMLVTDVRISRCRMSPLRWGGIFRSSRRLVGWFRVWRALLEEGWGWNEGVVVVFAGFE